MNYGLQRVQYSPPTGPVEPVTVGDVKTALRVSANEDNGYIDGILIPAAREYAERLQNSAIALSTWALTLDAFPAGRIIDIPLQPLVSVQSVQYVDENGATQTLASSKYTVDTSRFRGRIELKATERWPDTEDRINAVSVYFTAGYPYDTVPANIRQAILLLVGHWFEHREAVGDVPREIAFAVTALLNQDRAIPV